MVVLKIIGVVLAIILAILAIFGMAGIVFVAFLLIGNQETEEINNKTSESYGTLSIKRTDLRYVGGAVRNKQEWV